ncbi:peptide/nickel transport system substrate-binding protein [Branchiibius hedensis]|uniref:Peptide/nickel transport system substrate-binding protein n=1 Tax=Branchiibius hedensis TaxID=672460 RepID=A0A2Y9C1W8_9MICO|nr:peptide/nickel transport system substrate-binding protein [Branchiibius hedensis]SSA35063.1 peptide/nickel transport system substrate-binding protein [Branchiibius hedensis]
MAITAVLAGCAKGGSSSPTATSAAGSAGADSGKDIDVVTVALPGSLSSLYPGQEAGILNYNVSNLFYQGLVGVDSAGKVIPALATKWTQPKPTTYVFDLASGVKFSDGTELTAKDVKFSLDQAKDAKASPGIASYMSNVKDVAISGDQQVTITLAKPDPAFLKLMSTAGAAFITSEAFWTKVGGKTGTSSSLVVGTGPYQVTSFQPDSGMKLERNTHWSGTAPKAKSIEIKFIADQNTRLLAAKSGGVDIAFNVPLDQVAQWKAISGERVVAVNDLSYVGLNFDTRVSPFNDPKVREAFSYSVDRDAIVAKLLHGYGQTATAMMTPESLAAAYTPQEAKEVLETVTHQSYDMAKAKAALAASSHAQGFTAELTYPNTGPQLGLAAQSLAQNLKTIGITLSVKEVPIDQWLATIGDKTHGVSFMWYFSTTGDPAEVPSYLLGEGNPSGYSNAQVASLLDQASQASDPKTRIADLIKAESIQATDVVNAPLWWGQSVTAFSDKVAIKNFGAFSFSSDWGSAIYAPQ